MFFKLVRKGSQRSRRENSLFLASQMISIVAFYIILSLENQDVMIFLKEMESDAVDTLLQLIPVMYVFSLYILFFLAYFSGKYQMERRSHEFGMYLMMGMSRKKLFLILAAEELWSSLLSLAAGIPIAVFLSEIISLVTAKIVGLGIIGHQFTFSLKAVLWTIAGYCLVRLLVLIVLSGQIVGKEIVKLLSESQERRHKLPKRWRAVIFLADGVILLAIAYGMAMAGLSWSGLKWMALTFAAGVTGTFLLFHGLGILFDLKLKGKNSQSGLNLFTYRQLQESIFLRPNVLAVASLLVFVAFCCFGYGASVSLFSVEDSPHIMDYTFEGEEEQVRDVLEKAPYNEYIDQYFAVRAGMMRTTVMGGVNSFSAQGLIDAVGREKASDEKDILLNNLQYFDDPYLISLSGYNHIRELAGEEPLVLSEYQAAMYIDPEFYPLNIREILNKVLSEQICLEINQDSYELLPEIYRDPIVTDRTITISMGLIVSDDVFEVLTEGNYSSYWNAVLKPELIEEHGLLLAIREADAVFAETPLEYESYLRNIGRELFYRVAASYTTIYLAVIFLIISNTVLGVQFLMQQRKTGKRNQILVRLGCTVAQLCQSARKQITFYFTLPIAVALVSSIFGICSMFPGLTTTAMRRQLLMMIAAAIPVILVLCVVEWLYMRAVMRMSDKNIRDMASMRREED